MKVGLKRTVLNVVRFVIKSLSSSLQEEQHNAVCNWKVQCKIIDKRDCFFKPKAPPNESWKQPVTASNNNNRSAQLNLCFSNSCCEGRDVMDSKSFYEGEVWQIK